MSDEMSATPSPSALDGVAEDWGFSPFSDTEVKCETCGMNIRRQREDMSKHHDYHAAKATDSEPGTP